MEETTQEATPETPQVEQPTEEIKDEVQETQTEETQTEDPRKVWEAEKHKIFAALTRKDKELREREQSFKEKEKRLELADKYDNLKKIARDNPDAVLSELGLDYKYVTEYYLNDSKIPPKENEDRILSEIEKIKKAQEDRDKKEQQTQQAKVINDYVNGLKKTVESDPDNFPFSANAWKKASDVAIRYADYLARNYGQVPSNTDIMIEVEKHLEQEYSPLLQNSAIRDKYLGIAKEKEIPATDNFFNEERKSKPKPKTLTNEHSSVTVPKNEEPLDVEDSRKRAATLIKFR